GVTTGHTDCLLTLACPLMRGARRLHVTTRAVLRFKLHPAFADLLVTAHANQRLRGEMLALGPRRVQNRDTSLPLGVPDAEVPFAGFGVLDDRFEHGPQSDLCNSVCANDKCQRRAIPRLLPSRSANRQQNRWS